MLVNAQLPLPRTLRFSLRTILLVLMLTLLLLPLATLYFFRLYENELVRQTELELISQSAALAASYRQLMRLQSSQSIQYGYVLPHTSSLQAPTTGRYSMASDDYYTPIDAQLDLVKPMYPPRPEALPSQQVIDPKALQVAKWLTPIIADMQQITLAGVRVLDMNGTVIAGREEVGLSLAHVHEVREALRGRYASVIRQRLSDEPPPPLYSISRGTNIRVFVALPIIEQGRLQGVVYLSRTPKNILKHLYLVQDKLYFATFILLLGAVLLVMFVSSTISRPIRELIGQTQRLAEGEIKQIEALRHPVTYEVAQLSESFAHMSQALAERSDYIRRFASHVSHEFKTPLTSIQGALELLNEHGDVMPAEQQQRFLSNIQSDTQRLKNLVNRLLELARADALEPNRQSSLLSKVVEGMQNRYQERGLRIQLEPFVDEPIAIAPDALETILGNLFDNSLHHGASETRLTAQLSDKRLQLSVHDNGSGISAANRERIFTPFFTTRRNQGGTGLGLEIVSSLLKAYEAQIRLGEASEGAEFILSFKLSSASVAAHVIK